MHRQVRDEVQGRKGLFLRTFAAGPVDDFVAVRMIGEPLERYRALHKIPDHPLYGPAVIPACRQAGGSTCSPWWMLNPE